MKRIISYFLKRIYLYNVVRKLDAPPKNLKVNRWSSINKNTCLGDNVNLNGMQIHGYGKVVIGNYFHSGVDCLIISSNHNYKGDKIPYNHENILKTITIEDFVWIGSRVIIMGDVTIGEGAIVQAGSVVIHDIPRFSMAGGNPAKVFKYRDIEHFNELKRNKQFN